jgi:signal transduction histidine kinase
MLLTKALRPEVVRRGLEIVDICARHEAHMVENVLEMSRLVTGTLSLDLTTVDIHEVVVDAVAELAGLAAERQVRIVWPPEPMTWRARGDRPRLHRALCNLLENAVTFTPAGGRVDVLVQDHPSALRIAVKDTGIGFPPSFGPTLFSRFRQGNTGSSSARGGLGLGLALAKELIELHGGALTAESPGVGQGASFTITLPRASPGPPEITP